MPRLLATLALRAVLFCAPVPLQGQTQSDLEVRTISLRYLTPSDAAKLAAPYVQSKNGGAFSAGEAVRAITVRETPSIIALIERAIREQDHGRTAVKLRFQLIRADSTAPRDPAVAPIDSILRALLHVRGLRLEGEAVTQVDEQSTFLVGFPNSFIVQGRVESIEAAIDGRVRIEVSLHRQRTMIVPGEGTTESLISTGLTVPTGVDTVIGTSSNGGVAYFLTVRPERVAGRK